MKNKELFDRTIQILVKAYLNDTLYAGNCSSCAVGNLVAAACGIDLNTQHYIAHWSAIVWANHKRGWSTRDFNPSRRKEGAKQVEMTGYSSLELWQIERAFMDNSSVYDGLLAVVNVLCDIHGMNDTSKQEAKALFVKSTAIGIEATPSGSEGTADSPAIAQNNQ